MPYKNPYFFVTAAPNRFGFSLRFRSLVIIFIARKHINLKFRKIDRFDVCVFLFIKSKVSDIFLCHFYICSLISDMFTSDIFTSGIFTSDIITSVSFCSDIFTTGIFPLVIFLCVRAW